MNKKLMTAGALAGLIFTGAVVGTVSAQTAGGEPSLSEDQAVEIALLEVPGEVQEIELEKEDGKLVYEIEILNAEGQEFEVEIVADTGEVIEVEAEDDDDDD